MASQAQTPGATGDRVHAAGNLQRAVGNQAVQRLLEIQPSYLAATSRAGGTAAPAHGAHGAAPTAPLPAPAPALQAKLMVHSSGDLYEQEADHFSERVTSMPEPAAASASAAVPGAQPDASGPATPHGPLQMKSVAATGSGQVAAPAVVNQALASPSHSLDATTRSFMEPQFGRNFAGVRVHSGAVADRSARALGASAYTVGSEIVFAEGQFAPRTPSGQ